MEHYYLEICTATGALVAAFFSGLLQHTLKARDSEHKQIESNAGALLSKHLLEIQCELEAIAKNIDDQAERVIDRLEKIIDRMN